MTAQNSFEICPVCGNRSRRDDCMLCLGCKTKHDKEIQRNAQALIDGDFESITDMPDDRFEYVLVHSKGVVSGQTRRLDEAKKQLQAEEERIYVMVKNAITENLLKAGKRVSAEIVQRAIDSQVQKIKDHDEKYKAAYGRVFGLNKGLENLLSFIEEVKEKRQDFLADQKENQAEVA